MDKNAKAKFLLTSIQLIADKINEKGDETLHYVTLPPAEELETYTLSELKSLQVQLRDLARTLGCVR